MGGCLALGSEAELGVAAMVTALVVPSSVAESCARP